MKKRDNQITFRVAGALRAVLEDEAAADSRDLSSLVRKILVDHASRRVVQLAAPSALQELS